MDLMRKYERHISGLAFIVGFTLDYTFAPRIDNPYMPFVIGGYLGVAWIAILLHQTAGQKAAEGKWRERLFGMLPTAIQFVFGALMSILFVYYSRSAALAGSWPFLLLLGGMFLANEVFRDRVRLFRFQIGVFFFVFLMAATLATPVILRELGVQAFLMAGGVALSGTLVLLALIALYARSVIREHFRGVFALVLGMYAVVNALYFTHLIPPIPLHLSDSGVYHFVARDAFGNYVGAAESTHNDPVLHILPGESAYFYSAVFAPISLETTVVHHWEYRDPQTGEWHTLRRIAFSIVGGRDGGFRGYTLKERIAEGRWRVSVETPSGELLGRTAFRVIFAERPVPIEKRVLN